MISFLHMSLWAAALTALICLARAVWGRKLPKRTFRVLWAVVILRMLVPLSLPIMKINTGEAVTVTSEAASVQDTVVYTYIDGEFSQVGTDVSASPAAACEVSETADKGLPSSEIWLLTAAAVFAAFAAVHIKFRLKVRDALPVEMNFNAGTKRRVRLKVSDRTASPLTYGIFRPVILLPKNICDCDEKTADYILAHELTHIKRFDVLYKLLMVLAVSLHWFNPFAWVMLVLASRDIELSCDEEVILKENGSREEYALTLIELEEKRSFGALANGFGGSSVKERIKSVMTVKSASAAGKAAAVLLVAAAFTVFTVYDIDGGTVYSVTVTTDDAEAYYDDTSAVEGTYYSDYVVESAFDDPFTMEEIDRAFNSAYEIAEHALTESVLVEAAAEEASESSDTETKITYAITKEDGTVVLRDYPESYSLYHYAYADAVTGTNKTILLDLNVYSPFDYEKYGLTVSPEKGYYLYKGIPVAGFLCKSSDTCDTLFDDIAAADDGGYFISGIYSTGETLAQVGKDEFLKITKIQP